jgi:hypothetical protein
MWRGKKEKPVLPIFILVWWNKYGLQATSARVLSYFIYLWSWAIISLSDKGWTWESEESSQDRIPTRRIRGRKIACCQEHVYNASDWKSSPMLCLGPLFKGCWVNKRLYRPECLYQFALLQQYKSTKLFAFFKGSFINCYGMGILR